MDMFTSYGHIKKPKYIHRFFYDFSLGIGLKLSIYINRDSDRINTLNSKNMLHDVCGNQQENITILSILSDYTALQTLDPRSLRPSMHPFGHGASPQYLVLRVDGEETFLFFQTAKTGKRTPNSSVKGSGANHYPRAPALKACVSYRIKSHLIKIVFLWTIETLAKGYSPDL